MVVISIDVSSGLLKNCFLIMSNRLKERCTANIPAMISNGVSQGGSKNHDNDLDLNFIDARDKYVSKQLISISEPDP